MLQTVTNLVCGDAYLIDGQSNALATDTGEKSPPETSDWIRSYGSPRDGGKGTRLNLWCNPVWKAQKARRPSSATGAWNSPSDWWKARRFRSASSTGPSAEPGSTSTSGTRPIPTTWPPSTGGCSGGCEQARLTHGIRGILWHQGENDQGADGPTGGYGWETYQQYFIDMSAGWKQDYPNIQHYYVFQIWPNSCAMGVNGSDNMLREVQRTLPRLYSNMGIMSTLGIKPPGGCHYPLAGWAEFARLIQPLIERDNYGKTFTESITPPNLVRAGYTSGAKDEIALEFDQPVVWKDSLASQFYLDGEKGRVASGAVSGRTWSRSS